MRPRPHLPPSEAAGRLSYIDGLRTISVLLVILSHLNHNPGIAAFLDAYHLGIMAEASYQGVLIFFFISGYVITLSSLAEVHRRAEFSISGFYIRRVFRIIPPLSLYLVVCGALSLLGIIDLSQTDVARAFLYSCNVDQIVPQCDWYVGHTWSLAFEEQFYLCFPILFSFVALNKRISIFVAFPLLIAAAPFVFPVHWIGHTGFVVVYSQFLLGSSLAKVGQRLPAVPRPLALAMLLASLLITFLPIGWVTSSFFVVKYYPLAFVLSVPALVVSAGVEGSALNRFCSLRFMARIGRATYSIYLWQQLVTGDVLAGAPPLRQTGCVLVMIVACLVLYETVERRLIRFGRVLAARSPGTVAAAAQ